ncbi:bis(5'-nucleosyl)-tetraphosphatase (symmetrical) YqeK [Thermotoga sp. KOL6]|uniref:bis(5'-nucleosyl)-tetraphosphatase (symmetrical) YqeK n=1 Tax=Thermotoga sp. KOL6 TaxID=126741 RepID=UPI000C76F978|nr:bis(5'-nucleosyl)-tetraphosphatase (symmetrical) YqeK [Thermotoga sp. KOL6]PLV60309.1 metal-dependent phosphohydrolase [Thermotoga sp. KOL6]
MTTVVSELETIVSRILSKRRITHVRSVIDFSKKLGEIYGVDLDRLELAALSHDMFRDIPPRKLLKIAQVYGLEISELERIHPVLLHGKVAAEYLKRRFNVNDEEVLLAVAYHTSGHVSFKEIGKILFIADSLEYTRDFPGVDVLRKIAFRSLEEGFFQVLKNKIFYAVGRDLLLIPETVELWNSILMKRGGHVDEEVE